VNVPLTSSDSLTLDFHWTSDDDPSLGVREPRRPRPPKISGGAAADLHFAPEQEAEGISQGARVNAAYFGEAVSPNIGTAA